MRIVILLLVVVLFTSCSLNKPIIQEDTDMNKSMQVAEYRKISPEEAKDLMVEGNIILDVRTEAEYDSGHIPNAILLPVDEIEAGNLELISDKNQVILVYCRSGNRSSIASRALIEEGYTNVYDFGGIIDWKYEIEK